MDMTNPWGGLFCDFASHEASVGFWGTLASWRIESLGHWARNDVGASRLVTSCPVALSDEACFERANSRHHDTVCSVLGLGHAFLVSQFTVLPADIGVVWACHACAISRKLLSVLTCPNPQILLQVQARPKKASTRLAPMSSVTRLTLDDGR